MPDGRTETITGFTFRLAAFLKRVKLQLFPSKSMKICTVGSKSFVTSFQLAGVPGVVSTSPDRALDKIKDLTDDADVGLVLVSDDVAGPITDDLTALRAQKSALVFALPATGSEKSEVDYRVMLKKILGV